MKVTTSKKTIELFTRLTELNEQAKLVNKEITDIKDEIKSLMTGFDTKVLSAGDFVASINERKRSELDREKVKDLLKDKYDSVLRTIEYQTFEIKKS